MMSKASDKRLIRNHLAEAAGDETSGEGYARRPRRGRGVPTSVAAGGPLVGLALALVFAAWWEGAFAVRHWGLLALFASSLCVGLLLTRRAQPVRRDLRVALASVWALAVWTLVSMQWSASPSGAWAEAARTALYAAIAMAVLVSPIGPRTAARVGWVAIAGIVGLAVLTLAALLLDPDSWFIAGRLERPIGHASGTAALFGMALWPLIAVAAEPRVRSAHRGLALGGAALVGSLAFLSQSRGVLSGLAAGAVVALAAGPDRVRRAWLAIVVAGAIAAASSWLLAPYDAFREPGGDVTAADVRTAAIAAGAVVVISMAVGLVIGLLDRRSGSARLPRLAARAGLALVALIVVAAAAIQVGNPIRFAGDRIDEFRELREPSATHAGTRLESLRGQRYDLWRIAVDEFRAHPLRGVGAGAYSVGYYEKRRTERNTSDPHGLPFRILAETGIVGGALLALFLGALIAAAVGQWRSASVEARRAAGALGAGGVVVLAHSFTEWLWLLPAVMGLGILLIGLAVVALTGATPPDSRLTTAERVAYVAVLIVVSVSISLQYLSDVRMRSAREQAAVSPARQLSEARAAADLNPWSVTPVYLQASAQESLGRRSEARADLLEAVDLEPENFVTYALLGDLERRAGRHRVAQRYYRRALALNPRDTGLQRLARPEGG